MFQRLKLKLFHRLYQKGYDEGIDVGYRLGFQMGQVEGRNQWFKRKSVCSALNQAEQVREDYQQNESV